MSTALSRFVVVVAIVGFLILVAMLAQGIGESFGNGLKEWMVR